MLTQVKIPGIKLFIQHHGNEKRLFADFPYNKNLNHLIKEIPGARWSAGKKMWHFNLNRQAVELLKEKIGALAKIDTSELEKQWKDLELKNKEEKFSDINEETIKAIDYFTLWMEQKRYSPQTVKNYTGQLIQFLNYQQPKHYKEITVEDVERYNHEVIIKNGLSVSFQRSLVGTVKLFYSLLYVTRQLFTWIIFFGLTALTACGQNYTNRDTLGEKWARTELKKALTDTTQHNVINSKFAILDSKDKAIKFAEQILFDIYGEKQIKSERPYEAYNIDNY